jgi:NAD(P)-dependent dehydrogenase (short-subunit alcohol dehydrogenase family)
MTAIAGSIALVTGANRGIGRAFVDELLLAGATKVYAGARDPNRAAIDDDNVEVVQLDVTDPPSVAAAAAHCADVSLLINNAGYFANKRLVLTDDPDAARQEMEVNFWGALAMTRAFAPILGANGGGAIVNVLSVAGAVPAAFMGGYSTSKAATYFLSAITRAELAGQGTKVTSLIVGSVDTRMAAHVEGPKEDPRDIARAGLAGLERGDLTVDTDAMARTTRAAHLADPERLERQLAKLLTVETLRTQR